jgi:hypothetical protein
VRKEQRGKSEVWLCYDRVVSHKPSALSSWSPQQLADARRWVETWKLAGEDLARIHRKELRELDSYKTIALLCGPADYTKPPRAPKPWSGLVEQQAIFKRAHKRKLSK